MSPGLKFLIIYISKKNTATVTRSFNPLWGKISVLTGSSDKLQF